MKRLGVATVAVALVLIALHVAGVRADLGLLSGTVVGGDTRLAAGIVYVLAWFTTVLVAPIVWIARGLEAAHGIILAWVRTWRARSSRAR